MIIGEFKTCQRCNKSPCECLIENHAPIIPNCNRCNLNPCNCNKEIKFQAPITGIILNEKKSVDFIMKEICHGTYNLQWEPINGKISKLKTNKFVINYSIPNLPPYMMKYYGIIKFNEKEFRCTISLDPNAKYGNLTIKASINKNEVNGFEPITIYSSSITWNV